MRYVPKELRETRDISSGGRAQPGEVAGRLVRAGAILAVLYMLLGLVADEVALRIPERWEARLAVAPGSGDDPLLARPQRLLDRLVDAGELRSLPYRLRLLDLHAPNAVAFPGGVIGVTRGLLEEIHGDAGIAMVLAHELGHHQARHAVRRLGRSLLLWLPFASLVGEPSGLADPGLDLAVLKYSRDQEREADRIGLALVYRAFGSTEGALEFFERLERESDAGRGRLDALMATHPLTRERLDALRDQARALEAG